MGFFYSEDDCMFHLKGKDISYVMKVDHFGNLIHLYYGKKIRRFNNRVVNYSKTKKWAITPQPDDQEFGLDSSLMEYPTFGHVDFRPPALHVEQENGSTILDLKYHSHEVLHGKKHLEGLPAVYAEDEEAVTVVITLKDSLIELFIHLSYTVFHNRNVLIRSTRIVNESIQSLIIKSIQSTCLDLCNSDYELLQLSGAWARERQIVKRKITPGNQSVGSVYGVSSMVQNPFVALLSPDTTEDSGYVYGFSFVYSGNFLADVNVSEHNRTRLTMGINPSNFSWLLESDQTFQTPEVVMVYSDQGLGKMSREFHSLYNERLIRGPWKNKVRPIIVNNWEATYFDFNGEKIEKIADIASDLGIEFCVLDDGWFGNRNDDTSSLGDWYVNENKIEGGLGRLAKSIEKKGMKFGLWFEPEMISPNSDLYSEHPDWCLHVERRDRTLVRNQLVLDFTRKEVCDYIIETISEILTHMSISYVKWDMNRPLTDTHSPNLPRERQQETSHRYTLGVYYVLEKLTAKHRDILFESSAGGGGRVDPGMLYYSPQFWISDNTDTIERAKIQYGTSMVYPVVTMASHVSSVPNHQCGRITPLKSRGNMAMSGNLGYELDLSKCDQQEMEEFRDQIQFYKRNRRLIQFGDFFRINNPFEGNSTSWMFVSPDKAEAALFYIHTLTTANPFDKFIRCKGLDENSDYYVEELDEIMGGDELMNCGLSLPHLDDFGSVRYKFIKTEIEEHYSG